VYWADTPFFGQALFDHSVPRRPTIHLQPHQHLVNSFFVILRGPVLQAQATLGALAKERGIGGAFVPLTLTDEAAPAAIVSETPTVHATITPPPGVVGPPYFVEQTECPENETWRGWLRAATDTLTPGFAPECNANRKWIAYAGWLGHPITAIDYTDS
jgi:hypothetical protein